MPGNIKTVTKCLETDPLYNNKRQIVQYMLGKWTTVQYMLGKIKLFHICLETDQMFNICLETLSCT